MPGKCKELRNLIQSKELEFILEAHNGISATIVERTGFKAIWGSGFAMSAQFGVFPIDTLCFPTRVILNPNNSAII